ncbi:MAG: methyl-accepting chemotaxis protein [Synechococcales bacterium]|nr:methyl-accepting chemotaxis protein [Synechococcales bacterium]
MVDQLNRPKSVLSPVQPPAMPPEPQPLPELRSRPFQSFRNAQNWLSRLGIGSKATLLAIALSTLPTLVIGGIAYTFANRTITEQVIQTEEVLALTMEERVADFMKERYGDVQVLSRLPVLTNATVRENLSPEEKQQVLDNFLQAYGVYKSIEIFDLKGNITAQTGQEIIPNQKEEDYFKDALEKNELIISRPALVNNKFFIYLTAPVRDGRSTQKIAIVRAVLPIDSMLDALSAYRNSNTSFHLIDAANQVFLSSQASDLGQQITSLYPDVTRLQRNREVVSTEVMSDRQNRQSMLVSYAPWKNREGLPELNWDLFVELPTQVAFAPQQNLLWTFLVGTGVATLFTGLLAAWIANRATRPILAATTAVKSLGEGKLDTRLQVKGQDEIATLGSNINLMADELQGLVQQQTRAAEQSQLLSRLVVNIRRSLNEKDVLDTAASELRYALKSDRVVFYRFHDDWNGTITVESVDSNWDKIIGKTIHDPFREGLIDRYRNGRVRAMADARSEELTPCHLELLEGMQIRASVVAPIIQGEALIGLLSVHQCSGPRQWLAEEIDLVTKLAIQIGFALDEATLLKQTDEARQIAEKLSEERQQQKETLQMQLISLLSDVEGAAMGNLTVRADVSVGEIGTVADFFNSIIESLRSIVTQVKTSATQVNSALGTNETAIRQLTEESLQQAAETTRTLDSLSEMTRSMQTVANNAQQAAAITRAAAENAQQGGVIIDQTVEDILNLRHTIGDTAKKVKRLGESSQEISKVVSLINQIAMQTNLLAINAGIEAARAGEEGQGFAVVAEEVADLATRSAAATREIEEIVSTIQQETAEVIEAMEQGTTQVVQSTRRVSDAKQQLGQVVGVSHQVDELVQAISNTTISQVQTSSSISKLMQEIAALSQRTANSSNQVADTIRQTVAIAQELQSSVGTFTVD